VKTVINLRVPGREFLDQLRDNRHTGTKDKLINDPNMYFFCIFCDPGVSFEKMYRVLYFVNFKNVLVASRTVFI
jgi:hypothetical protein